MKKPEEIKKGLECCVNGYKCGKCCPYNRGKITKCTSALSRDALAYIQRLEAKLAEYEKPLEPMTLEEAKKLKGVWIEDDGCYWGDIEPTAHPALYYARINGHLMAFVGDNYMDEEELAYFEESEYNKTWRCWPRKPTDEERKAAKWDEK